MTYREEIVDALRTYVGTHSPSRNALRAAESVLVDAILKGRCQVCGRAVREDSEFCDWNPECLLAAPNDADLVT